jgi:hypothetical protein
MSNVEEVNELRCMKCLFPRTIGTGSSEYVKYTEAHDESVVNASVMSLLPSPRSNYSVSDCSLINNTNVFNQINWTGDRRGIS